VGSKTIRKVRSDKKIDVKPIVPIELKDCIYRLSYITDTPVQHVIEFICEKGIYSEKIIGDFSQYFQQTVRFNNTFHMGSRERPRATKKDPGITERIYTRFSQSTYENIETLANALKVSPSRATCLLLDKTIQHKDIMNIFVRQYLSRELDDNRMRELKKALRFINKKNSTEEDYSWFVFLSNLYDELKDSASSVSGSIKEFLDRWKTL
jgi:hypothetical protein